jgi:predicted hotdog family 3-hydroxylacyl-ACP dehydratase
MKGAMIEKEELLTIMPHRGRMSLLTKINEYDLNEESIEAEYHLTEDCLFYDPSAGGVPAWVGFEFIAQAVSAYMGIKTRIRGEPVKIGFILGVSGVRIGLPFFKAGSIIVIKAKEYENMDPLYIYTGEIFIEGRKVLEGKLTVMEVDNEKAQAMKKGSDSIG